MRQLLLGNADFVKQYQATLKQGDLREVSIAHRRILALSMEQYQAQAASRNQAMAQAYQSGAYTMAQIAEYFGVHYMPVSRAVRALEDK